MYRPDNWDDIEGNITYELNEKYADKGFQLLAIARAVEAGADAILDGLKKNSLYGEYLDDVVISARVKKDDPDWAEPFFGSITKKGWLVYIPDEEG